MKLREIALTPPVVAISVALVSGSLFGVTAVRHVSTVEELLGALADPTYDTIELADGEYQLAAQLKLDRAVTLKGNGYENCLLIQTNKGCRVVSMTHADARLEGVTAKGGSLNANTHGAGLNMKQGTVVRCRITGNKQLGNGVFGSGVYATGGLLLQCVIDSNGYYNTGGYTCEGGGVFLAGATTVDSCLITNNLSDSAWWPERGLGGGVYVTADGCSILNSTIVGNRSAHKGGGIYSTKNSLVVKNCIVAGNTCRLSDTNMGYPNWCVPDVAKWTPNVSNCLWADEGNGRCVGTGSRMCDPMFTDAASGDYTLAEYSPAIGLGAYYDGISADLVGTPRRNPPDVGCFQSSHPLSLSCTATFGPNNVLVGTAIALTSSVSNARSGQTYDCYWTLTDLEGASRRFLDANPVVTDLAPGDYEVLLAVSNRAVALDNAFAYATNRLLICTLTNYVTSVQGATPIRPYARPETAATSIDDALALTRSGSIVFLDAGTHKLGSTISLSTNVTVQGAGREATVLKASATGCRLVSLKCADALVRDLTLTGGSYGEEAGCVQIVRGRLVNCAVVGNKMYATNRKGLVYCSSSEALIDRCVIASNEVASTGYNWGQVEGVVYVTAGTIRNTIICDNLIRDVNTQGSGIGHVIYLKDKNSWMENCTIVGNEDRCKDGGAVCMAGSYQNTPHLYNTILSGNTAPNITIPEGSPLPNLRAPGQSYYYDVQKCFFVGSAAFSAASFVGTDAKFVDAAAGDYRLQRDSPCRNKGLNRDWLADALDVYGVRRLIGRKVDIGATETESGLTLLVR